MPSGRTLDEFAVSEEAQEVVTQHRPHIEQLFGVELNILGVLGLAESPSGDAQGAQKIWLQLQGHGDSLQRAKEYIKGLCAPELSEEVYYPKDMQCIFLGAHGLFLNCLIQGTSAHVTFLRPGVLLISGLAEAFVMAQSRIQEFLEKHQKNLKLPEEREAQVKRAFRDLVETYDDKHAMDLLILPTSVKEELLNLVKEIQEEARDDRQENGCWTPPGSEQNSSLEWEMVSLGSGRPESPKKPQHIFGLPVGLTTIQEESRSRDCSVELPTGFPRPQETPHKSQNSAQPQYASRPRDSKTDMPVIIGRPQDQALPQVSRVDFPRGFAESELDTRPQGFISGLNGLQSWHEASTSRPALPRSSPQPILAAKTTHKTWAFPGCPGSLGDKQEEGKSSLCAKEFSPASLPEETSEEESSDIQLSSWTEKEFKMRLNFFKTMGYEERVVKKILLEGGVREAPSTILDRVQMAEAGLCQKGDIVLPQIEPGGKEHSPSPPEKRQDEDEYLKELIKAAVANCGHSPSQIPTEIQTRAPLADLLRQLHKRGEEQEEVEGATGTSATKPEHGGQSGFRRAAILTHRESSQWKPEKDTRWNSGSSFHEGTHESSPKPAVAALSPDTPTGGNCFFSTSDSEGCHSSESTSLVPQGSISTVTGAQRFEEALQTQFKLKLANTPGKKNLRMVIIDGSNVAMMHGLNQFFSCRGIALAVQYFWDRGHREVTVLVPQHRMEEDSNVRERHYLVELHKLSILSLTPSRKIDGKGIVPYDDRFMLKLAEQTNGVIVTNDQFRDLAKESKKWIKIIKESGRPAPASFPVRPTSQTEVLQLRDRKPPGVLPADRKMNPQDATVEKGMLRPSVETERLRRDLLEIFVGQDKKVDFVLMREPYCEDLNKLSEAILSLTF
ncbi:hypothetical protein JD844_001185 [Phrynosoma platyrhinos]|uniref:RNase NYN domain-containing protein n=1 Tax=Phrynosoma platyrhinos TaxID=52577 RepID=A0ABQ7T984_PHRPL|nr:hypothetical protein JD844_001185 [Phrynosoma platyrhinos]